MIGTPRVHWRRTDSTNERARELASAGAPHGTLVTAGEQTAGRGRQGRAWNAPPGSAVLMSVVLRDFDELLPLAAAVATCDAVPLDCMIKWPNDVWAGERKLAGILAEARPQEGWAVLGIGLNVTTDEFPPELRDIATSLRLEGASADSETVLQGLLAALERRLGEGAESILPAWRERDALKGRQVRWSGGEGIAAGIDDSGALQVQTDDGLVTLEAGEVHLERPN
ncbi:MAG TPA: biotin--[acetyl-CoA-carboxylase] ligase [Thermoleophilaceae bacterium]|nr:biotin--[acetyl-CoA-carboxylase] ligase [Thermoleophilaceae bacterium]